MIPVVLEGRRVRLVPMGREHVDALWEVARDPELWRESGGLWRDRDDAVRYVETALDWAARGEALPFVTTLAADGSVIGSTRFAAYAPEHGRVEIGWTFVARAWQRTAANPEAKLLLLRHAFETLGLRRVELKTDALNATSRRAILALGAREEGTLRSHMLLPTGRVRDTVYFSILADEWPAVRAGLESRLAAK
jgi:RimJ/RimL family protein N-acetyltransferase